MMTNKLKINPPLRLNSGINVSVAKICGLCTGWRDSGVDPFCKQSFGFLFGILGTICANPTIADPNVIVF